MRRAVLAASLWLAGGAALAQSLEVSPETAAVLAGSVVGRGQAAEDDRAGSVVPTALGPVAPGFVLPGGVNLDAFDRRSTGEVVFSTDVAVAVPGLAAPGIARAGDVVRVSATQTVLAFSASAAGIPAGVNLDAVGLESDGDLLLSFDATVTLVGLRVDDEDVVRLDSASGTTSLSFDGSAQGIAVGLDLDAVSRPLASNHLLLSFDGSGIANGQRFEDEDVLDWNRATGAYTLYYDGSAAPAAWAPGAELDAVSGFSVDADADGVIDTGDNCPFVANPSQSDVGGIGLGSGPDGIGDDCQCGDVTGDGRVLDDDVLAIRDGLTAVLAGVLVPQRCNILGPLDGALLASGMRADCDVQDVSMLRRALAGATSAVAQVCVPAAPP